MGDSNSSSGGSGGIGFVGLLTIVFITLKLLGKIDWSWWWVLSPVWISALLFIGFIAFMLGGVGIVWFLDFAAERRQIERARKRGSMNAHRVPAQIIDRKKDDSFIN